MPKPQRNSPEYHESIGNLVRSLLDSATHRNGADETAFKDVISHEPQTGRTFGRYKNAHHYSDGLFSEVFKAVAPSECGETTRSQIVALKVTTPDMMTPPHDSKREARILIAVKSDHIIPLVETFQQAGGRLVLVFPFMPYGLDGLLPSNKLPNTARRTILHDLFSGLAHIHEPLNEKILDVGTTCYRPPELLFGHGACGTKLDIWAAGCVAAQVVCLNGKTLFDAGELGSELALIKSMFETLGTPDLVVWPEAAGFPDWGKMNFTRYPARKWEDILAGADPSAVDLLSQMVVFESGQRLNAEEARKMSEELWMVSDLC
ncbi:mitogen-activated protein kinase [Friedmanniomyces endolithicus]|nr:mitogen-activated protein kinase [Friedmanniomyces endolithicus]